ncbi:MAG: MauE/DoxX family redox-associated membrane protein [Hymenobacter sp.]
MALLVFFTFLTFIPAAFNKVTDCGCFGDFVKLTPWTSFAKDVFLLVLWVVVFLDQRFLRRAFAQGTPGVDGHDVCQRAVAIGHWGAGAGAPAVISTSCLYKVGNSIPQVDEGPSRPPRYQYTFTRDGQTLTAKEFAAYPDSTWTYQSMTVPEPRKSKPHHHRFPVSPTYEGNYVTQQILTRQQADPHRAEHRQGRPRAVRR